MTSASFAESRSESKVLVSQFRTPWLAAYIVMAEASRSSGRSSLLSVRSGALEVCE